jgi:hypothetical protein
LSDERIFLISGTPVSSGGAAWRRQCRSTGVSTSETQKPQGLRRAWGFCLDGGEIWVLLVSGSGPKADSLDVGKEEIRGPSRSPSPLS